MVSCNKDAESLEKKKLNRNKTNILLKTKVSAMSYNKLAIFLLPTQCFARTCFTGM